jgi:hypothetical protein
MSVVALAVEIAPASASISVSPKLVGTYDVTVQINPRGVYRGQITLESNGLWSGSALDSFGCVDDGGSWLLSGRVLALSDLDAGGGCDNGGGMTWMATVGTGRKLGSVAAPGYINSPYTFNATWDAVPASALAPIPSAVSKISPKPSLVGTYSSGFVLNADGSWTDAFESFRGGTWLVDGSTVALSDNKFAGPDSAPYGGTLMATILRGHRLGSATKPGYANYPGDESFSWWTVKS